MNAEESVSQFHWQRLSYPPPNSQSLVRRTHSRVVIERTWQSHKRQSRSARLQGNTFLDGLTSFKLEWNRQACGLRRWEPRGEEEYIWMAH